jgi:adenosylcobinamide amidohydrolase
VAMTGRGATQPYAGPATVVGWLIGKAVRQAVHASLKSA